MWLDDPELFTDELIDKMLNTGRYKEEFVEADREHVIDVSSKCVYALICVTDGLEIFKYLVQWDHDRGAWTNEDPEWDRGAALRAGVNRILDLSMPGICIPEGTTGALAENFIGAPVERSVLESAFASINLAAIELAKQEIILPATLASVIASKMDPISSNVVRF